MSAAADEIRENAPGTQILEFQLDLADTKTVSKAIEEIKMREIKIDILRPYHAVVDHMLNLTI